MNRVLRYVILSLLVLLPHLGWGQFIWHEDMDRSSGTKGRMMKINRQTENNNLDFRLIQNQGRC